MTTPSTRRLSTTDALATVTLPAHVAWSTGGQPRDLSDRAQRLLAYQLLLAEGEPDDIGAFVDGTLLVDAWPDLHLPPAIRAAWQPLIDRVRGGHS